MHNRKQISKPEDSGPDSYSEVISQRLKHYLHNPDDLLDWDDIKDNW